MKTGKYTIKLLLLTVLLGGSYHLHAQPNTLYFMKGIPQTKDLNPARPGITDGFYFSMPLFSKLDLSANTNNWAYNDLIHKGTFNPLLNNTAGNSINNSDSLVIDLEKFMGKIGNKNFVYESAALTVLEGGFKKGKNFYAASITEREFTNLFFNKDIISLIYYGNKPYVGQTYYSGNLGLNAQHYREFAFNYARDITRKLTVGGAVKILFGMGAVQTNGMNFKATSPDNGTYLDVTATGRMNISAPVQFTYSVYDEIKSVDIIPDYTIRDYLKNFQNPGIAVDLGFAYHVNKKTELSASVIDLGMIGWKSNVTRFTERGNFLYQGINLNNSRQNPPVIPQLNNAIDSLGEAISRAFRPTHAENSFSTLLPAKIYFGVDHQLSDAVSLSGLSRIRIINDRLYTSLTASANTYLWNALSLTASYSIMESTYDNLGLGIGIKTGPLQIYAAADNFYSPFYPAKARNMNVRIGINLIFNDKSSENSRQNRRGLKTNVHCP